MIKVFLSLPIHGHNTREVTEMIDKMEKAVIAKLNEHGCKNGKVEFITNYYFSPEKEVQHMRPYCLGEAIKKMADCELIAFHPNYRNAKGCTIEKYVCKIYGINHFVLNEEEM
ncbi:MAG: hypothetical protein MJ126_09850 [Lachnospiraceae bacterium]|nr:hypothetical protein [Lachnospiraceae bacterium]